MRFFKSMTKHHHLVFLCTWTMLFCIGLWISYSINQQTLIQIAYTKAEAYFTKDIIFRSWVSGHGGVYAPISEHNQPNPYLSAFKERDISTPSGKKLTLINPAYMNRQVNDLSKEKFNINAHITSLNPIRIKNKADLWENKALRAFGRNELKEMYAITTFQEETYFRFMRPLKVTQNCLKCHAYQGYRVGDIRGGISISLPIKEIKYPKQTMLYWFISILWVFGILVYFFISKIKHPSNTHDQNASPKKTRTTDNSEKFLLFRTFSIIFFPSLIIISLILCLPLFAEYKSKIEILKNNHQQSIEDMHDTVITDLHAVVSDLLVLSSLHELIDFFDKNSSFTKDIEEHFISFSLNKGPYDQVRLINTLGDELIRVDYNRGMPAIVSNDKLQNKKHRYYFEEALALQKGEVYISPIDLNIENKKIERPLKPMIRLATPVFDRSGNKQGILILNYLSEKLIYNLVKRYHFEEGIIMLLNNEGYWLKGERPEEEWGFMFADKQDLTFKKHYPEVWEQFNLQESGQYHNKAGLFTFSSVFPQLEVINNATPYAHVSSSKNRIHEAKKQSWKIVSVVHERAFGSLLRQLFFKMLPVYIIVLITLAFASWRLAVYRIFKIKTNLKLRSTLAQVEELSITDELTQLYNKRYFNQSISKEMLRSRRTHSQLVFCIFDIDSFKLYNDTYGHQAGDGALRAVGRVLKEKLTRASDHSFRLGGEEFGILSVVEDRDSAYRLIDNIRKAIEEKKIPHEKNQASQFVTASFGCFMIDTASEHNVSSIYESADQALYKAKQQGKNRVIFY